LQCRFDGYVLSGLTFLLTCTLQLLRLLRSNQLIDNLVKLTIKNQVKLMQR